MKSFVALALCLAFASAAYSQNWPSFRGKNGTGVGDGNAPPTTWDVEKSINVLWKTPIPGLGHSSPIVWGERVFITTAVSSAANTQFVHGPTQSAESADDTSKHSFRVYCLDKNTGRVIWQKTIHEGVPKVKRHVKASHANPTPVTDGQKLVVSFGSEGLYCFDFEGKLLWKQDLGILDGGWSAGRDFHWGFASSPVIYKRLVIIQCDTQKQSFIAALNLADGKRVWQTPREEDSSWSTPTIYEYAGGAELITSGTKFYRGYDPLTGKELWRLADGKRVWQTPREEDSSWSTPTLYEYAGGAELITSGTKFYRGYDPLTGKELWRLADGMDVKIPTPIASHDLYFLGGGSSHERHAFYAVRAGVKGEIKPAEADTKSIAWRSTQIRPHIVTPIVYGDYLYACTDHGILSSYHARTGEQTFRARLGSGGSFVASPVAADGKLYFASEDGDVFVVKAGPTFELLARNSMGEVLMSTPAIAGKMIIIRGQQHVFGIAERD